MISQSSRQRISRDKFVQKQENIYGGIEAEGFQVKITDCNREDADTAEVSFQMQLSTLAGSIKFNNQVV